MSEKEAEFVGTIDNTILKEVVSALAAVSDNGVLRISKEGITSKFVNPENVALVSLDLKRSVFTDYTLMGENLAVGMDFDKLLNILKVCSGDTRIKITTEKKQIKSGYLSFDFPLLSTDALRAEPKVPAVDFSATVTIELEEFKRGINIADSITGYVEIGVNSEEFFMGVEGSEGAFKLVIPKGDLYLSKEYESEDNIVLTRFNADTKVKSKFSTEYLVRMANRVVGKLVTLKIRNDYPLQMPFKITDGCEVTYLLAPRIDAD